MDPLKVSCRVNLGIMFCAVELITVRNDNNNKIGAVLNFIWFDLKKTKIGNKYKRRKAPVKCPSAIKLKPETGGLAAYDNSFGKKE
jgi:hypothetical protein